MKLLKVTIGALLVVLLTGCDDLSVNQQLSDRVSSEYPDLKSCMKYKTYLRRTYALGAMNIGVYYSSSWHGLLDRNIGNYDFDGFSGDIDSIDGIEFDITDKGDLEIKLPGRTKGVLYSRVEGAVLTAAKLILRTCREDAAISSSWGQSE